MVCLPIAKATDQKAVVWFPIAKAKGSLFYQRLPLFVSRNSAKGHPAVGGAIAKATNHCPLACVSGRFRGSSRDAGGEVI
ncbi:MAG: hypothetical protein Q8R31_04265 [Candidatus Omnitrophota bacterium]|nr:hypothetical protein [Candidatus Omnitrophota bacterium]